MSETTILILMSIPLLLIFIMGIYSLILLLQIDEELEERKKVGQTQPQDDGDSDDLPDLAQVDHVVEVL